MEALREAENPSLKKSVAQIIKNDPSWPLVSSISGGAKADMIKLLVLGYEMSGRSFDEMDKEGLTSLGAAILSSDDTEVGPPARSRLALTMSSPPSLICCCEWQVLRIVANRANLLRPFNNGLTPLWAAVKGGDLDKVCILLDAAMSGQSPLEKEDRKRFLEEKSKGSSPLWLAVSAKSNDIAERLVAAGADVLSRGKNHSTPMHQVLRSCDKDQTPNLLKVFAAQPPP